mgnify:CR=1 FL=1
MVLVPEIVLTPQMMRRFSACFGDQVAMLHSSLRMTERYDQWKRIRRGEVQVVLGTRSAIFAPLKNVGLIVLDEEQESSYQSENPPRYHTRDVAKYLCARDKSTLVLGVCHSGGGDRLERGAWDLSQGAAARRYNRQALPEVLVADLKQEIRAGNAGMVGQVLRTELEENLRRGEQSILLLNRRGSSRYLLCGECGHVPGVSPLQRGADVSLRQWAADVPLLRPLGAIQRHLPRLRRHHEARGHRHSEGGGGLHDLFPGTEVLRMDADTAEGRHEQLLDKFGRERIPILLGTQMVAKGLDFPQVTLVGGSGLRICPCM